MAASTTPICAGAYEPLAALSDDLDLAQPADAARQRQLGRQRSITGCRSTSTSRCRTPATTAEPYLAFLGRLSRDKRPDRAIEIARRSGLKLKIAAKIGEDDRAYFHETIEPLIDGDRHRVCRRDRRGREGAIPRQCRGLLFPIDWPEPFGLVVIEAMACGTPVIAWDSGAMPEIVDEGVTGFIVDSIRRSGRRGASACPNSTATCVRLVFERRFSAARMVDEYAAIYARQSMQQPARRERPLDGDELITSTGRCR